MTDFEVYKIIAEFMGSKDPIPSNLDELSENQIKKYLSYVHSLDALLPVWEKLKISFCLVYASSLNEWVCGVMSFRELTQNYETRKNAASKAAAYATAKAILDLHNK